MNDYFDRVERQLVRSVEAGARPRRSLAPHRGHLAPALGAVVVLAVIAVFLAVRTTGPTRAPAAGTLELVYRAEPTAQSGVTPASLARSVAVMRERLNELGAAGGQVSVTGADQISVQLPDVVSRRRAEAEVGNTARLFFYDWEANVLTPNGRTVASQLLPQDPNALTISRGDSGGPGVPGAGSMSLYNAVKLASKQTPVPQNPRLSRLGPQYYLFGNGGTPECAAAAKTAGVVAAASGTHCLLAGPINVSPTTSQTDALNQLYTNLQPGIGQVLVVPQGTAVLQAVPANFSHPPRPGNPSTQFYVLKDNVALFGNDITNPQQGTDTGGNPDVQFGFTSLGQHEFHSITSAIAKRGSIDSPPGSQLNQHFAVALDNLLITVPQIDYKSYPFGVPGNQGADITGRLTIRSAQDLATELRLGALPLNLKLISVGRPQPQR